MPLKIAVQGVIVHRAGKNVTAPLNEPFDFTDAELADIAEMNPAAIRDPIVEVQAAPAPAPAAKKSGKTSDPDL